MCGNFGLLMLSEQVAAESSSHHAGQSNTVGKPMDALDMSLNASMHEVSRLNGIRLNDGLDRDDTRDLITPNKILKFQTASTEIRGGQAGGYSCLQYRYQKVNHRSNFDARFGARNIAVPNCTRVRMVARKRHPLAADLSTKFLNACGGKTISSNATTTVVGHTRFATSSINRESELHPHEWVPFHEEPVWLFNTSKGRMERVTTVVGCHISHNGDFDALDAYCQRMLQHELGYFLERVLHTPNHVNSDSVKIAGYVDLFRVQGRWAAAARAAWVRCILNSSNDVTGGEKLSKTSPNSFPGRDFWESWRDFFEGVWTAHINNIVQIVSSGKGEMVKQRFYQINSHSLKQFVGLLVGKLLEEKENNSKLAEELGLNEISYEKIQGFVHFTVRGFLYADLYNVMTEFLSRAEGSFGLQFHSTLEPGVVVIGSKGQPMSMAYDPLKPIALFGSEAEALSVPVYESQCWLPRRLDLDGDGEIVRVGVPKALLDGSFCASKNFEFGRRLQHATFIAPTKDTRALVLDCGVEIRAYSLVRNGESTVEEILVRTVHVMSAPTLPTSITNDLQAKAADLDRSMSDSNWNSVIPIVAPKEDLVAEDLKVTPAVIAAIDRAWVNEFSVERVAGGDFAERLLRCMQKRIRNNKDTTDLLIAGVEVSLWLGEQFAADLRRIFPYLNIVTCSTNKLLGLGDDNASKVFFPVADEVLLRKFDPKTTCALLISQSGQTFSTLHATRKISGLVEDRLWLLTGCFNSKMEQALTDGYLKRGQVYMKNRVFNNYSGHRPAEPSTVATVATWHTLTRLLLNIIQVSRKRFPSGRIVHPWEFDQCSAIIQNCYRQWIKKRVKDTTPKPNKAILKTENLTPPLFPQKSMEFKTQKSTELRPQKSIEFTTQKSAELKPQKSMEVKPYPLERTVTPKKPFIRPDLTRQSSSKRYSLDNPIHVFEEKSVSIRSTSSVITGAKVEEEKTEERVKKVFHKQPLGVLMNLSDGCIHDMKALLAEALIHNIANIVGYDEYGRPLTLKGKETSDPMGESVYSLNRSEHERVRSTSIYSSEVAKHSPWQLLNKKDPGLEKVEQELVHNRLVAQGRAWAAHIKESWRILVISGVFILISVGFGLSPISSIAHAVLAVLQATVNEDILFSGTLLFSPRYPDLLRDQPVLWTLLGLFFQILDALFFIYVGKNFAKLDRILQGRPLAARLGKRTIVIVDSPCVHQLLENYVSKLFSQSYSVLSVEVHGASGLDHFVHRFTHRVSRGLLLAVGRPDGRLCCLAKSEASVLLATKQAAFIQNPDYSFLGSGPEIVTIGHNPFRPSMGLAHNITLSNDPGLVAEANNDIKSVHSDGGRVGKLFSQRRKFVDEYLYERLFMAEKPFYYVYLEVTEKCVRAATTTTITVHVKQQSNEKLP